jgi:WD40 repeat protein
LHELKGHAATIYALGFHPDGKYVVTGSYDRTVRLWNVDTGECTLILHGFKDEIFTVSFFDHGRKLMITETEGMIHVLDIYNNRN